MQKIKLINKMLRIQCKISIIHTKSISHFLILFIAIIALYDGITKTRFSFKWSHFINK